MVTCKFSGVVASQGDMAVLTCLDFYMANSGLYIFPYESDQPVTLCKVTI